MFQLKINLTPDFPDFQRRKHDHQYSVVYGEQGRRRKILVMPIGKQDDLGGWAGGRMEAGDSV